MVTAAIKSGVAIFAIDEAIHIQIFPSDRTSVFFWCDFHGLHFLKKKFLLFYCHSYTNSKTTICYSFCVNSCVFRFLIIKLHPKSGAGRGVPVGHNPNRCESTRCRGKKRSTPRTGADASRARRARSVQLRIQLGHAFLTVACAI